ncbi:MAG: ParB/RepB/Spo0J family partition protein, partial [Candidatus Sulfotelmatobacter sp.]
IPISEIRVVNPRTRSKGRFQEIVASIDAVGLKKPITVSRREVDADGTRYDLVCGQGRMEACRALGEMTIPAVVTDASREEQLVMSLVENFARRPPSNRDLLREVRSLRERKYKADEIARKVGLDRTYINGIIHLLEHGEEGLAQAVEAGRLPISVAVKIATGNDQEVQQALAEAYETGDLRGDKLRSARRMISLRISKLRKAGQIAQTRRKLTGEALVREYKDRMREQRQLVKKANLTKERLLLLISAIRRLMQDEHFATLLRAESLIDMPEQLAARLK